MTTATNHDAGVVRQLQSQDVAADELNLGDAVLGGGLVLRKGAGSRVTLHTLEGGRARLFGSFANAAEAWRALDELDAPEALDQAA